jgi:putative transposase
MVLKWHCMGYEVKRVCQVVGLSRPSFYRCINLSEHTKQPILRIVKTGRPGYSTTYSGEIIKDEEIKVLLKEIAVGEGYNYGYRKMAYCLRKRKKIFINKKKVYRLCKEAKLLKPPYQQRNKAPKRLARNRVVNGPNQLWQGDIKHGYIRGEDRNFYVLSYVDVFERTIVGYTVGRTCLGKHAGDAIRQGLLKRQLYRRDQPLVVRTDNGPQFTSLQFASICDDLNIEHERIPPKTPNMNAYIEAYHSILEDDFMRLMEFESMADVREKLDRYVKYYNQVRLHGSLQYCSPDEYYRQYLNGLLPDVEIHL